MTFLKTLIYILLVFGLNHPYQTSAQQYEFSENIVEALQRGEYLWRQNNITEALIEFENVMLMDETNIKGLTGIFRCHLKMNQLAEARDILESIQRFSMNSSTVEKLRQLLNDAEKVADQEAAETFFQQQLEDFSTATESKEPEVRQTPKPLKSASIKTPQGKFAKSIQLHKKGFTVQAIPLFMEALMEEKSLLFANDHGLLNSAREYYIRSSQANPKDVKNWFIMAWISEQYADIEKTKELYQKITEIASRDSSEYRIANAKLTEIKSKEGEIEKARRLEQERLEKDTQRFRRIQISNGQYEKYSITDYTTKGLEYYDAKNIPEAVIHLQGAIKVDPQNPETHYHYAMIQVESAFNGNENGFSIAKRELETCLNLDPEPGLRVKAIELLKTLNSKQ